MDDGESNAVALPALTEQVQVQMVSATAVDCIAPMVAAVAHSLHRSRGTSRLLAAYSPVPRGESLPFDPRGDYCQSLHCTARFAADLLLALSWFRGRAFLI